MVCTGKSGFITWLIYSTFRNFRIFTAVNMFGVIFVFCFLPETKGKSLEEIEEMFTKKKIKKILHDKINMP